MQDFPLYFGHFRLILSIRKSKVTNSDIGSIWPWTRLKSTGWAVYRSIGRSLDRSVCLSVCRSVDLSVCRLFGRSVGWSVDLIVFTNFEKTNFGNSMKPQCSMKCVSSPVLSYLSVPSSMSFEFDETGCTKCISSSECIAPKNSAVANNSYC